MQYAIVITTVDPCEMDTQTEQGPERNTTTPPVTSESVPVTQASQDVVVPVVVSLLLAIALLACIFVTIMVLGIRRRRKLFFRRTEVRDSTKVVR